MNEPREATPLWRATAGIPSWRPTVVGRRYAVTTGHYLATAAAVRVLERGGNAIDAGVTASLALAVLQPDIVSFAGVAPTLVYEKSGKRVTSLAGLGYWPAATDIARLREAGGKSVPEGLLRTVLPAAPATHVEALRRFGTIAFREAAAPAYELARDGFAVFPALANNLRKHAEKYRRYPENARIFQPGGRVPQVGEPFTQADLARTILGMIDAEERVGRSREAALSAVHDHFYRGPIAATVADYHAKNGGFLTRDDLAGFEVPVESSIAVGYRGYEVHACDVWCQGIVLLETLKILEGIDLRALDHNSAAYIHTLAEALNLAFADRERYVGDPKFVDVPTAMLLSDAHAAALRRRIDPERAFGEMPQADAAGEERPQRSAVPAVPGLDTIYCGVVDAEGNAYSATLSDNARDTPVIPGTGLTISGRGCQSRLDEGHPSEVKPGKRPRLTPSPGIVLRDGEFFLAFGTPGGDVQCQAMLQVFLNIAQFGMHVQQAIEAPRFATFSFPNSFAPHEYLPGRLCVESRVPEPVRGALARLGHDVETWPEIVGRAGAVCAILRDRPTSWLHAGADPRRENYAAAW